MSNAETTKNKKKMEVESCMSLYRFLSDRDAVNLLKFLYQKEVVERVSYVYKLSAARNETGCRIRKHTITALRKGELITTDEAEREVYLSITAKGKEIIEIFDSLVDVYHGMGQHPGHSGVHVHYELSNQEKRVLLAATKIAKGNNHTHIPLKTLTQELYPHEEPSRRISLVSRYADKLAELNLVHKKREDNKTMIAVTDKGYKAIKKEYLKDIVA